MSAEHTEECVAPDIRRTFWRATGPSWTRLTSSLAPGCGDIQDIEPNF